MVCPNTVGPDKREKLILVEHVILCPRFRGVESYVLHDHFICTFQVPHEEAFPVYATVAVE